MTRKDPQHPAPTPAVEPESVRRGSQALEPTEDGDFGAVATEADDVPLTPDEVVYARAARAPNTLRGYASDWREFTGWCNDHGTTSLPAAPSTLSGYLVTLAAAGASVGTMNRRRAAIRLKHTLAGYTDPCTHPRVVAVWEGIRRTHAREPDQSLPLMPPLLLQTVAACPIQRRWKNPKRPPEPDLAGARDRALLLIGFVGALRRSELAGLTLDRIKPHPDGLVLSLARSKTNQRGDQAELVILPRSHDADFCPVNALEQWLQLAGIGALPTEGATEYEETNETTNPSPSSEDASAYEAPGTSSLIPVFQGVAKGNRPTGQALHPESVNVLVQAAIKRTGRSPDGYSAHSLRAGFVTWAHLRGATDRAIAHQTRHRSMTSLGQYVRISTAWKDNAATDLGL